MSKKITIPLLAISALSFTGMATVGSFETTVNAASEEATTVQQQEIKELSDTLYEQYDTRFTDEEVSELRCGAGAFFLPSCYNGPTEDYIRYGSIPFTTTDGLATTVTLASGPTGAVLIQENR